MKTNQQDKANKAAAALATASLTQELYVSNILAVWYSASLDQKLAGETWYATAREISSRLALTHGITVFHAAGVVAALSPMKSWTQNVKDAQRILANSAIGISAIESGGTLTGSLKKCDRILDLPCGMGLEASILKVLNGRKISSFFSNIVHPATFDITVDGHAYNIAQFGMVRVGIPSAKGMGKKAYKAFQEAYRIAAERVGVLPSVMQAVTWVTYKDLPIPK